MDSEKEKEKKKKRERPKRARWMVLAGSRERSWSSPKIKGQGQKKQGKCVITLCAKEGEEIQYVGL